MESDETVHYWDQSGSEPAACGLNLLTTPYTYGSPVWGGVSCPLCLMHRPARDSRTIQAEDLEAMIASDRGHLLAALERGDRVNAHRLLDAVIDNQRQLEDLRFPNG
jgi:hypothetical protein